MEMSGTSDATKVIPAIIGFTALALTHPERREQVEEYLKKIMTSGNHLLSLINDVLDINKLESGNVELKKESFSLPQLFSTMVHLTLNDTSSAEAEEIDRSLQPLDKALFAEGNPSGLKCLLHHLGLAENVLRLPLVPVGEATDRAIAEAIDTLGVQIAPSRRVEVL